MPETTKLHPKQPVAAALALAISLSVGVGAMMPLSV